MLQVVPFSPSSGLLEWVEHTLPIADYLLSPNRLGGAHARYKRPGDLTWYHCYQKVSGGLVGGLGPVLGCTRVSLVVGWLQRHPSIASCPSSTCSLPAGSSARKL